MATDVRIHSLSDLIRTMFYALLTVLGIYLLEGVINFAPAPIWLPFSLIFICIFTDRTVVKSKGAGLILVSVCLYLLSHFTDTVAAPWLRYVLGVFFILVSVSNIMRNARGGSVPLNKTLSKQR
jgi:hypothetical protein